MPLMKVIGKGKEYKWIVEYDSAFEELKCRLIRTLVLAILDDQAVWEYAVMHLAKN